MQSINATPNPFGGLVVEAADLPEVRTEFEPLLERSIASWRSAGARLVWMTIPLRRSELIDPAVKAGFVFHHASPEALVLTLTLVPDSHIPPYATHYIGAGGAVLTDDGRLLVVSERYRRSPARHLKLPGGALHPGEHIEEAVVREIREETGIETRFERLVCFRHWHGYRYAKSDIYFVCRLSPLSMEIRHDPEEIDECLWMPVQEFLSSPDVHDFNRRIIRAALSDGGLQPEVLPGYGTPESHELFMPAAEEDQDRDGLR